MEYFKLSNYFEIPALGCGTNTFGKKNHEYMGDLTYDTTELVSAIEVGYRHFDTAVSYRNEEVVGLALEQSGIDRGEFFITSKLPTDKESVKDIHSVQTIIEESLARLRVDYIDLYLVHHPMEDKKETKRVWRMLEGYAGLSIIRSIGVSNFSEKQLEKLLKKAEVLPVVNQIESHPGHWNHSLIEFCQANNILPVAWSPLRGLKDFPELAEIGQKYGKSAAQVALRYQIDRGVAVIPKSVSPARQAENFAIFDFTLSDEDRKRIGKL